MMTTWITPGLGVVAVVVGWWGLSSFEHERFLSPIALTQWLNDAGPWGPLILIGSMVCAVFTNISLKTFAFATLFGMAPPTVAFTYLGSSVVGAQWPLIGAGAAMVMLFLAMPKILTK